MSWADLMQCALVSDRFLMIGDPGQIPPVVPIDVRRWETSPRAPHEAAPEVVLAEPSLESVRFVGSLPACRRLPNEAVDFVKPFYDFDFEAYVAVGARGLELLQRLGRRAGELAGRSRSRSPPPTTVRRSRSTTRSPPRPRRSSANCSEAGPRSGSATASAPLAPADIGVTSSHRVMNSALAAALGSWANQIRVDTPERWQGLERPVMIAVHPLSGVADPSAFDLETGRLCVMASRHQAAFIVLTRDHVGETLRNYVPSAEQAPGRPDIVGRGPRRAPASSGRSWRTPAASCRSLELRGAAHLLHVARTALRDSRAWE